MRCPRKKTWMKYFCGIIRTKLEFTQISGYELDFRATYGFRLHKYKDAWTRVPGTHVWRAPTTAKPLMCFRPHFLHSSAYCWLTISIYSRSILTWFLKMAQPNWQTTICRSQLPLFRPFLNQKLVRTLLSSNIRFSCKVSIPSAQV